MQEYTNIDQTIHQLSQIIAKANRTFVTTVADDSHTNLYFDYINHRVYGRWISSKTEELILALNVETFSFEWVNKSLSVVQSHTIENKTILELEQAISNGLSNLGLKSKGLTDDLHFEIPVYDFAKKPFVKWDDKSIQNWEFVRDLANTASFELLGLLQTPSEIRIWPHHFDTGIYVQQNKNLGLGFGLAMEDTMLNEPYFYFSGYGLNDSEIDYSSVNRLTNGKWITGENWNGAVLPLSELGNEPSQVINTFLKEAVAWFLK